MSKSLLECMAADEYCVSTSGLVLKQKVLVRQEHQLVHLTTDTCANMLSVYRNRINCHVSFVSKIQ